MVQATATRLNRPAWVDLASPDAAASRAFYAKLFGWQIDVNPDPQYGGYGIAKLQDGQVGGIGPSQSPDQPTAWSLYVGTSDVEAVAKAVPDLGGAVLAPPFDVGDQGRMATFTDPTGAAFSVWKGAAMRPFRAGAPGTFVWAELNARGLGRAVPFYEQLFGWTSSTMPYGDGQTYTQFAEGGENILGAMEMQPQAPASMPSYWMVYFGVNDVDRAFRQALDLGATEMVSPADYPGGRFAIVTDPQGAMFGMLQGNPEA